ncbi:hypothetical protein KDW78_02525 [Burkholderia cenocepacia]|nr:hypothetical protein [Burkholderia cenocepacia]MBR7952746.1 hypothetical protein [Burkholderia cenocepacia]
MPVCFLGKRSRHPAKVLAAMPATVYRGAISVFTCKSGRKALLDIVRM